MKGGHKNKMVELKDMIKLWIEKLSLSEEEIMRDYNEFKEEENKLHPTLSQSDKDKLALQKLATSYRRLLRSPAVSFEGMIIGASDVIDVIKRKRAEAIKMYKENPQHAIAQGITDENGNPLETKQVWADGKPYAGFGKPLEQESLLRNVYGIAGKKGSSPSFFIMTMNGNVAKTNIPLFTPIRFRAIDKGIDGAVLNLRASSFTTFKEDLSIQLPPVKELIDKFCSGYEVKLSELDANHKKNKDNNNRLAITIGDVTILNLEPTKMGSRIMVIDSEENITNLDSPGVTCWVPKNIKLDFAEQSKVIVVGRTAQGKKKDVVGNLTDEDTDISLNVYGVYAIPEFKISPIVEEITEENVTTDTKEVPEEW